MKGEFIHLQVQNNAPRIEVLRVLWILEKDLKWVLKGGRMMNRKTFLRKKNFAQNGFEEWMHFFPLPFTFILFHIKCTFNSRSFQDDVLHSMSCSTSNSCISQSGARIGLWVEIKLRREKSRETCPFSFNFSPLYFIFVRISDSIWFFDWKTFSFHGAKRNWKEELRNRDELKT